MTHETTAPSQSSSLSKGQVSGTTKKKSSLRRTAHIATPDLELFQREEDPGSHLIRSKLSEQGLDCVLRNVPSGDALKNEELVLAGGKARIPFLIDHRTGTKLYGTQTILTYLNHEYGEERKTTILRVTERLNSKVQSRAEQLTWVVKQPIEQLQKVGSDTREAIRLIGRSALALRSAWKMTTTPPRDRSRHDKHQSPGERSPTK